MTKHHEFQDAEIHEPHCSICKPSHFYEKGPSYKEYHIHVPVYTQEHSTYRTSLHLHYTSKINNKQL